MMRTVTQTKRALLNDRMGSFTFEEFCSMVEDGQKADLIEAVIHIASPDNMAAGNLFLWLARLMGDYVELKDLGSIFGSRIAFRLSPSNSPEPDLAFVVKDRLHLIRETYFEGSPDLAIEIVSPESIRQDYGLKCKLYQNYKVAECWIIDEEKKTATCFRLERNGKYREMDLRRGIIRSQVLQGFCLRIEWLWAESRPNKGEALKQILTSP
jgi:Uma2 family endonuclease